MRRIGNYLKKHVLLVIRCVSFGCLIFIAIWSLSSYEFSDGLLYGFPMFCLPFEKVIADKKFSAILFPLILNIALWISLRRSYPLIYGVWVVEKWKAIIGALGSLYFFLSSILFYPQGSGEYFWSFFLPIVYFVMLHYGLKEISGKEFLKRHDIEDSSQELRHKTIAVSLFYTIVLSAYILEYNLQRFYGPLPLEPSVNYSIEDGMITDVSSDENTFISFVEYGSDWKKNKIPKGIIEIYDFSKGGKLKTIDLENGLYAQYGVNDSQIIVQKADYALKEGWINLYDIQTDKMIKEFPHTDFLAFKVHEIKYSTDRKYFATRGLVVSLWDIETEKLLDKYEDLSYEKEFIWLDNKSYFIIQRNLEKLSNKEKWKAEVGEITKSKDVKVIEKKNIAEILTKKIAGLYHVNFYMKEIEDEKTAVVIVTGIPSNGLLWRKSYMLFIDVEKEDVIFSLDSSSQIKYLEIYPEENYYVTIEEMRNDRGNRSRDKVIVWNLQTKEKEKTLIIGGMRGNKIRWTKEQDGYKMMELGKHVQHWKID